MSFSYTSVFCKQVNTDYFLISFCLGSSLLPLWNRLPHYIQLYRKFLLRKTFWFPYCFDVFFQHRWSLLSLFAAIIVRRIARCRKQRRFTFLFYSFKKGDVCQTDIALFVFSLIMRFFLLCTDFRTYWCKIGISV